MPRAAPPTGLRERGFAFARIAERKAVVDHETRTMDVTYIIDPGPLTRYGDVRVQGLDRVTEQLVRNRVPWKPGEEYRPAEIEDARSSISDLGTFSSVRVGLDREPGPDGVTPVTITVAERPRRVIGAGFSYSTEDGFGHQCLLAAPQPVRRGGAARLSATLARIGENDPTDIEARLNTNFRKPDFLIGQSVADPGCDPAPRAARRL